MYSEALNWTDYERIVAETKGWPGGPSDILPNEDERQNVLSLIDTELSDVQKFDLELQNVQDEIKRLHGVCALIELRKKRLLKIVDAHRVYVSPIRRVPDDILREIMVRCLPLDVHPSHMDLGLAPMLLTHICRRWRLIAHSTPRLWSSLCVSFRGLHGLVHFRYGDDDPTDTWKEDTEAMRWWLAMAGSCPLRLSFREEVPVTFQGGPHAHVDCVEEFYDLLLETSPHWDYIDMAPTQEEDSPPLLELVSRALSRSLPLLSAIKVHSCSSPRGGNDLWSSKVLLSPNLRELALICAGNGMATTTTSCSPYNWSRLTVLKITFLFSNDIDDAIKTLPMCTALEELGLLYSVGEMELTTESSYTSTSRISFMHLHKFRIDLPQFATRRALRAIAAPRLKDFSLLPRWHHEPVDLLAAYLREFLEQSSLIGSTRMQALEINPVYYTSPGLVEMLQNFPAISRLALITEWDHGRALFVHPSHGLRSRYYGDGRQTEEILKRPSNVDDAFLQRLAAGAPTSSNHPTDAGPDQLLPRLEELVLLTQTQFTLPAFERFIDAKRRQPFQGGNIARLRKIIMSEGYRGYLCESSMLDKSDVLGALEAFKEGGLRVEIVDVTEFPEESPPWRR